MKWVDYREKLGIGFDDSQKFKMLCTVLKNYVENIVEENYDEDSYLNYCQMVGEVYSTYREPFEYLSDSLGESTSMQELVAKYIAFCNTYSVEDDGYSSYTVDKDQVLSYLKSSLEKLNIKCEVMEDQDGTFIFPIGAKELDDALVSEPLEWLKDYPNARRTFINAIHQYSNGKYIRDAADNFRKAFEEFLKEFYYQYKKSYS